MRALGAVLLVLAASLTAWALLILGLIGIVGLLPAQTATRTLQAVLVVGAALLVRACFRDWRRDRAQVRR